MDLFAREIDREFPEVRQIVDELYAAFAHVNAAADAVFERDAVWPPGTLWERIETRRAAAQLPLTRGTEPDLLGKFPVGHPYRDVVKIPVSFATDPFASSADLPPLALARLHGAWTRGIVALEDGEDELEAFPLERIEAHGGDCRLGSSRGVARRPPGTVVAGVREDGEEEITGAGVVVSNFRRGARRLGRRRRHHQERATELAPTLDGSRGFVVSLIVNTEGLPEPWRRKPSFYLGEPVIPIPRRPVVRLQRAGTENATRCSSRKPSCQSAVADPVRSPSKPCSPRSRSSSPFWNDT